jgi:hypothetical protein
VDSPTLHWAARRHLARRYQELTDAYAKLPNQGRADDGHHYLPESWTIFPRYHTVAAILVEVERLDPDRLPELPVLVDALLAAADTARSAFTVAPANDEAAAAIADERRQFRDAVRAWHADGDLRVDPLPYRRVLTATESTQRQDELSRRWGLVGRSWHPLLAEPTPPDVPLLAEEAMWDEQVTARLRSALSDLGGRRVTELREFAEHGPDCLLDVHLVAFRYTGATGVWSDDTLSWIAFASHEGTVAFGGRLADHVSSWPDLHRWRLPTE